MKKTIVMATALTLMIVAFGACKPKQSAYRAAYEQAKSKATSAEVTPVEASPVRTERIRPAAGEDATRLKRYGVVIGSFRNRTNAYSLKERMMKDGYKVVLGENEQGMLRVIVAAYDDRLEATRARDTFKAKYAPDFQDAWLLEKIY
ncbi:MAG: SPOR domain-containing protein [Tannerellaceae bacterium]|jgi:cell division protein FtsN|nr:SPOR domain-containing protein [Tannerellaceae bacterium]